MAVSYQRGKVVRTTIQFELTNILLKKYTYTDLVNNTEREVSL